MSKAETKTETPQVETALVDGVPKNVVKGRRQGPLPEPGHARDEELKKRHDDLQEQLALLTQAMEESGIIDNSGPQFKLADMSIENEIAERFDMLKVPGRLEEYDYCWVNFASQHGIHITAKQAQGWEVVGASMPECPERKDELGRRRVGDVILMRIRAERGLELRRFERARRRLQQEGIEAAFMELGERYQGRGIIAHAQLNEHMLRRAQAKQIASRQFDSLLKSGQVPGARVKR